MERKKSKSSKLKNIPHSAWRKHRDGSYYLSATYWYKNHKGENKCLERKSPEETLEGVMRVRERLKALAETILNQQKFGVLTNEHSTKFGDLVILWLSDKRKTVRKTTADDYEIRVNAHLVPALKDEYIANIDLETLKKIIDPISETNPRTAQLCFQHLSSIFKFAVKRKFLQISPLATDEISSPKHKAKEIEVLTKIEAKAFLKLAARAKHGLLFELALFTGMRPEEYLALQFDDLDFQHNAIIIRKSVALKRPGVQFQDVKRSSSRRMIPIPSKLVKKLKAHVKSIKSTVFPENHQLVFPNQIGKRHELRNLTDRHFRPLMKKVNETKHVHLYMLRHTCATLLLLAGENPKVVSERLGNSIEIVLKTYSHVLPNMQISASEKLEKMLT